MDIDKRLQEQEHRAERVAEKEKLIIESMGYEQAFYAVGAVLCDYDKELIYDAVLKDMRK